MQFGEEVKRNVNDNDAVPKADQLMASDNATMSPSSASPMKDAPLESMVVILILFVLCCSWKFVSFSSVSFIILSFTFA